LKNLVNWREGVAKKIDRPRGHVIKDAAMLEIARQHPTRAEDLQLKVQLSRKALAKYGETIAAIVSATLRQRENTYPPTRRPERLSKNDKASLEKLNKLISLKCELLGIDPGLIGNSSELKLLIKTLRSKKVETPQQLRQTEGWRKHFLEDFFRQNR